MLYIKLKEEMEKCTFEGTLDSDPDSKVTFTNCKDSSNLSLISSKVGLSSNTFRKIGDEVMEQETTILTDDMGVPSRKAGSEEEKL